MRETAQLHLSVVPVGNGSARGLASVSISVKYVITHQTVPMGQTSLHFAIRRAVVTVMGAALMDVFKGPSVLSVPVLLATSS